MRSVWRATTFGFLIGIGGLLAAFIPFIQHIEEDLGLGLLFKMRGVRKAPDDVVVVSIDRDSAARLDLSGSPSRWPRSTHATMVERLARAGARVITFDVYFTEPRSSEEDQRFAGAIKEAGNVVLAEPVRARDVAAASAHEDGPVDHHRLFKSVKPIPVLAEAAVTSAPFVLPRFPVKVSRYWTFQASIGDFPTFPVVAFQLYALPVYSDFLRLFKKVSPEMSDTFPDDGSELISAARQTRGARHGFRKDPRVAQKMIGELERSQLAHHDVRKYRMLRSLIDLYGGGNHRYLNYYGPPRTLATLPYHEVLKLELDADASLQDKVHGKAVFIGLSENLLTENEDSFYTVFGNPDGVFLSGVEIAATAFANLMEDSPVRPLGNYYIVWLILGWGLLIGVVCRVARVVVAAVAVLGLSGAYLYVAAQQFAANGVWSPILVPLFLQNASGFLGASFWKYYEVHRERKNIRDALGFYVPAEVIHQLANDVMDLKKGDQTVYGVCLFSDAAGYTTVSEAMGAQQLGEHMRKYLDAAFRPIKENDGLILDLKGDSILAIWRGGRSDAELRTRACHAALGLAEAVKRFNSASERFKLPTRIGVHAGQIFLGNVGSAEHYAYGARGDAVNTASRLEGLNKIVGTRILVSDEVLAGTEGFLSRRAGAFLLKGKSQPVTVHELTGRVNEASEGQKAARDGFADAMESFRRRCWSEAREKFQSLAQSTDDELAGFYRRRCEEYEKHPPRDIRADVILIDEK